MAYVSPNFKSKKELFEALQSGKRVSVYSPGPFGCNQDGIEFVEGPHYPEPHRWYAKVKVSGGMVTELVDYKPRKASPKGPKIPKPERIISENRLAVWCVQFETALAECCRKYQSEYPYSPEMQSLIIERMRNAWRKGTYNHNGKATGLTCKHFGIRHTLKAIESFLTGRSES